MSNNSAVSSLSKKKWNQYFKQIKTQGFYDLKQDTLRPSLTYEEIQILLALYEQVLSSAPLTREQIVDRPTKSLLNNQGTFSKRMSQLLKRGLVANFSSEKWVREWKYSPGDYHGSKELYCLTARGLTFLEYGLHLPFLAFLFSNSYLSDGALEMHDLCYAFLKTPSRPKWHESYFRENQLPISDYHLHIIEKQKVLLEEDYNLFWEFIGPEISVIRNISILTVFAASINGVDMQSKSKNKPTQRDLFRDQFTTNYLDNRAKLLDLGIINGYIEHLAKDLGVSQKALYTNLLGEDEWSSLFEHFYQ